MSLIDAAKNAYLELRSISSRYPVAYRGLMSIVFAFRPAQRAVRVRSDTEIVIDGFPRSANTFFTSHFELAQTRPMNLARHLHDAYQITYAERHSIPAVVLIRHPVDAISSALLRDPDMHAKTLLRNYVRFYSEILKQHRRAIIATFSDAIERPNSVIGRLNKVYKTDFGYLDSSMNDAVLKEVAAKDLAAMGRRATDPTKVAAPSDAKAIAKRRVLTEIEDQNSKLLDQCIAVYADMISIYNDQLDDNINSEVRLS